MLNLSSLIRGNSFYLCCTSIGTAFFLYLISCYVHNWLFYNSQILLLLSNAFRTCFSKLLDTLASLTVKQMNVEFLPCKRCPSARGYFRNIYLLSPTASYPTSHLPPSSQ
jgi:hypothetical protein